MNKSAALPCTVGCEGEDSPAVSHCGADRKEVRQKTIVSGVQLPSKTKTSITVKTCTEFRKLVKSKLFCYVIMLLGS